MKIALLTPFYPYRGGIAQFSDRLYQELIENGEVKVFSYSTLYPKLLFPGQSQYVPNPINNPDLPSERVLSSIGLYSHVKTAKAINEFDPDVLIVAYWMPYMAVALSRVCKRLDRKIKIVGLIHNALPHEKGRFDKLLAKLFLNRCHAFITMSQNVREDLASLVPNIPSIVLEHPIYDQYPAKIDKKIAQEELGLNPSKKTLLFFGLIRSYKGLDLLIEAMGKLDDSYQLIIAGESYSDFIAYQQLIDLSKNRENIKVFQHYIPNEMVSKLFSATDVLVLPYRSATQSGVIAVALQLETPIIATNVGALGVAVKESGVGIVVPEISAESIAKGIREFFQEDDRSKYISSLRKEKTRLSWANFVQSVKPFIGNI